ncbi:MAG: hypothetical protein OEW83_02850 [Acidimicrobiia bacterium]|nr:hypothetical protein [Acidimicrobiia bacterium]
MDGTHECRSIAKAGHTGDRRVVEKGLTADDPRARVLAIGAAVRLEMLDVERIVGFLSDESHDVRYRALEVLPKLSDRADGTDAVIAQLADPELAELAAFTLGEIEPRGEPGRRAVDALRRQATGHDDALCRESAVAALGALGAGIDAILAACDDIATVRRRAVLALAPFEGPAVEAALIRALEDRDWQVRQAAEDLLSVDAGHDGDD